MNMLNKSRALLLFDEYAYIDTKVTIELSEYELNQIINTYFGTTKYEVIAHECLDNSVHTFTVSDCKTDLGHEDDINDFITQDGNKSYVINSLLQEMYNVGVISKGTYLIDCTW